MRDYKYSYAIIEMYLNTCCEKIEKTILQEFYCRIYIRNFKLDLFKNEESFFFLPKRNIMNN